MAEKKLSIIVGARDEATKQIAGVRGAVDALTGSVAGMIATYASYQGAKEFYSWTIANAIEAESVSRRLSGQLEALGYKYAWVGDNVDNFTQSMLQNSRFSDEEASESLRLALQHVEKLSEAEALVAAASKIASRNQKELADVTQELSLGYEGVTRGLKQYGIIVDGSLPKNERYNSILEQINQKYSKAVQEDMQSYAGKIRNIGNAASEEGEKIGTRLLEPMSNLWDVLDKLGRITKSNEIFGTMVDLLSMLTLPNDDKFKEYVNDIAYLWGILERPVPQLPPLPLELIEMGLQRCHAEVKVLGDISVTESERITESFNTLIELWKPDRIKEFSEEEISAMQHSYDIMFELSGMKTALDNDYFLNLTTNINLTEDQYVQLGAITTEQYRAQVKAAKEAEAEKARLAANAKNIIASGAYELNRQLVDAMFGARLNLQEVWKGIAKDFMMMFLEEVERAIAKAVIKWVAKLALFDQHENDMIAMKSGQDYAQYFIAGVDSVLNNSNLTSIMNIGGSANIFNRELRGSRDANITININNPIGTEEYIRTNVVPTIEALARRLETDIVVEQPFTFPPGLPSGNSYYGSNRRRL